MCIRDRHSAAGLLNEMRFSVAAVVAGRLPALDVPLLRQATECLANSLASVLVDNQPLPAEPLVALTNTLQQVRLAKAPTVTDDPPSVADFSDMETGLAQLECSLNLLELPELAFETTSKVSTDNARPDLSLIHIC